MGGHVFNNTAAGLVMQPIGMHRRTNSIVEREFLSLSSMISKMWSELTETKRNDWRQSALLYPYTNRVGVQSYLSGYNHFTRCVGNLYASGANYIPPAPGTIIIIPATDILIDPLGPEIIIQNQGMLDFDCNYIISASPTYASTKGDYTSHLRQLYVASFQLMQNGFDLLPYYMDVFGRYDISQKITIGIKAVNYNSGISVDNYWRVSSTITP